MEAGDELSEWATEDVKVEGVLRLTWAKDEEIENYAAPRVCSSGSLWDDRQCYCPLRPPALSVGCLRAVESPHRKEPCHADHHCNQRIRRLYSALVQEGPRILVRCGRD